jgi:hypothetical protein
MAPGLGQGQVLCLPVRGWPGEVRPVENPAQGAAILVDVKSMERWLNPPGSALESDERRGRRHASRPTNSNSTLAPSTCPSRAVTATWTNTIACSPPAGTSRSSTPPTAPFPSRRTRSGCPASKGERARLGCSQAPPFFIGTRAVSWDRTAARGGEVPDGLDFLTASSSLASIAVSRAGASPQKTNKP